MKHFQFFSFNFFSLGFNSDHCFLFFLIHQLLLNLFLALLWKQRSKRTSVMVVLISLSVIILNGFIIHRFFSKSATKLLIEKHPYYFPKFFHQETKLIMKVQKLKFKKTQTTEWAIMITLTLVNFWIFSQLLYLKIWKIT